MKRTKKLLSILLAITVIYTCLGLFGCQKKPANDANTIEVQIYDRGYGTDGIKAVAEKFMEKNNDIKIHFSPVTDNTLGTDIYTGADSTSIDVYFYGGDNFFNLINKGAVTLEGVQYDNYFEPLTEVYNAIPEGETRPIKEKMYDGYEEFYNMKDGVKWKEDTYYCSPWVGGLTSIVYNSKMFTEHRWPIPTTTEELVEVCRLINNTEFTSTNKNSVGKKINVVPFSYCLEATYWREVYMTWWAQYDGIIKFENFFKGQNENGEYTSTIAASDGRRYMFNVIDQLLGTYKIENNEVIAREQSEIFCDPNLCSRSYIDTQYIFLSAESARVNDNGATTSVMMPNGDWLENEMYNNFSTQIENGEVEFKMMKIPVVSEIINHPDCATIADDSELRALIKAIDNGSTKLNGTGYDVDQKAFDKIKEARGLTLGSNRYTVYVPAFSNAKDAVKEFLIYLYSDEGLKINAQVTRGQDMPFEFDFKNLDGISKFHQSKFDIYDSTTNFVFNSDKYAVNYRGRLYPFMVYHPVENKLNVSSGNDYVGPYKIFQENYKEVDRLWKNIMSDAGIV